MASDTRLLVLGVIRILQPVHGYDIRRELRSWRLEDHANVKPGSIYSAIRTLHKDGCIAVHSRDSEESRPERVRYVVTPEGEKEFQLLMREAWWTLRAPTLPLIPALSLMVFMPREELIRALQARIGRYESELEADAFLRASIKDGATGAEGEIPEHVREVIDLLAAHAKAELEWARTFQRHLREGRYQFAGEGALPQPTPGHGLREQLSSQADDPPVAG